MMHAELTALSKKPSPGKMEEHQVLLRNRRARHDYTVEETLEAGLVLQGSEVKSLRESRAVLGDAYAMVRGGEAWLVNLSIAEYPWANRWNHEPTRDRKMLLHKREIEKLDKASAQKGYTLLPLELYLKSGRMKVLIGICRGKKQQDRRQDEKRREAEREMEAALRRKS
jgi:SsrA-binding protein